MTLRIRTAARLAALVLALGLPAASLAATVIEAFSPEGLVKAPRQVTVRFTEDQVALGDTRLPDPFDVQCPVPGSGRWVDTRNWAWDFERDLPGGLTCRFTLRADPTQVRTLTTGGASLLGSLPEDGSGGIDAQQIFILRLDAPVTLGSVRTQAACLVEGIAERLPVQVLEGEERRRALAGGRQQGWRWSQLLQGADADALPADELVVLRCPRPLPEGAKLRLFWGRGVTTVGGSAGTVDLTLDFTVRPAFSARLECTRVRADAGCVPILPLQLWFTAPVPREQALAVRLRLPDGSSRTPEPGDGDAPFQELLRFPGPFPESTSLQLTLPPGLVDDAGRPLQNAARFPLAVGIDELPPLAKFSGDFGILEAREGGVLPVTLRNLEPSLAARQASLPARSLKLPPEAAGLMRWLQRVQEAGQSRGESIEVQIPADPARGAPARTERRWRDDTGSRSVFTDDESPRRFNLPKPEGAKAFEVVGIPLRDNGLHVVEIESRVLGNALLGRDQPRYVATAALVTDLAVHFKWGQDSSVVWVTRLSDGEPVGGAQLQVANACSGQVLWRGGTDGDGLALIRGSLGEPHGSDRCTTYGPAPLMVLAQLADDYSFVLSGWDKGIQPWQFGLETGGEYERQVFHTVTDRALLRAGETVSMKHFLRRRHATGLVQLAGLPAARELLITHDGSGQEYRLKASFGADGVAESTWTVPEGAPLGRYRIALRDGGGWRSSGSFRVAQFRLPTMTASINGPSRPLVAGSGIDLDVRVAYLSGGGAAQLPVTVRAVYTEMTPEYRGLGNVRFGGDPVQTGLQTYDGEEGDGDSEAPAGPQPGTAADALIVLPVTLDDAGTARVPLPPAPQVARPMVLVAELEYPDANGERLTAGMAQPLLPASIAVGLDVGGWNRRDGTIPFEVVVVDAAGKPQPGRQVGVQLYQKRSYSFRKRLVGGFYGYATTTETRGLPVRCDGQTDTRGRLACKVAPGAEGEILLRAEGRDDAGRLSGATTSVWVYGRDEGWFGEGGSDRMDLLPEHPRYESGETARLQVRMPFRRAKALVTVEREGVLSAVVRELEGREPLLEVPVQDAHAPNVFVSVLAVRGRVASARASDSGVEGDELTALVDLNKPSWRLGMARLEVGWKPHRLQVQLTPERGLYRIRETARVHVQVRREDGRPLPAGAEIALAAVDAALLRLAPNESWQLLEAMMGSRGLEVRTATAQMQVVGKRHFGRKAVPAGGGGGFEGTARRDFSTLLAWHGRVALDAHGEAWVSVPLNDSLTEFRLAAIAHAGASLFGMGSASIRSSQDLVLTSGLPPVVRAGDQFLATFSLRNTTQRTISVEVGGRNVGARPQPLSTQRIELAPGRAQDLSWRVTAPADASAWRWELEARDVAAPAGAPGMGDRLQVTQRVIEALPVRAVQATLMTLEAPLTLPVQPPAGAVPGRGGLSITLRPKLGEGLDGVREYFRRYPYSCIEQQLSRSVGLGDLDSWNALMAKLPSYQDSTGLLRFFPEPRLAGDDVLTSYVLALSAESGRPLPEAARSRMIEALQALVAGQLRTRRSVDTADLTLRKLAAIAALARHEAATADMLDSITPTPTRWPASALLDWIDILQRLPAAPRRDAQLATAYQQLRTRLTLSGSVLAYSPAAQDEAWWLMVSPDVTANRLLLAVLERPEWRADLPRLLRGVLARQKRGHWDTTVANAWGTLALQRFSALHESAPLTGVTTVRYGETARNATWDAQRRSAQVEAPWSPVPATLQVTHAGTGRPWLQVQATAALPLAAPVSNGYRLQRSVTPVRQRVPGRWSRGDVMRVRLEADSQADMTWVVLEDPVPAGATVLGTGLGGQSQLAQAGEHIDGDAAPAWEERRQDVFRAYYAFLPKGRVLLEYTLRLDNPGSFQLPPTRIEAMYSPDLNAQWPNTPVVIER
ncbi:MAG: hypothetical protein RL026_1069 [Pseudomonadota bacterium]